MTPPSSGSPGMKDIDKGAAYLESYSDIYFRELIRSVSTASIGIRPNSSTKGHKIKICMEKSLFFSKATFSLFGGG